MRPSVLALLLWGLTINAAAEDYRFDDAHPPAETLLRTYIYTPGGGLPQDQADALDTYLTGKDPKRASGLELQARFVKHPPTEEELKPFVQGSPGPSNLNDAVTNYLANKPVNQMTISELTVRIKTQEAAKAANKNPNPIYDEGLRQLYDALAVKKKESPTEDPPKEKETGTTLEPKNSPKGKPVKTPKDNPASGGATANSRGSKENGNGDSSAGGGAGGSGGSGAGGGGGSGGGGGGGGGSKGGGGDASSTDAAAQRGAAAAKRAGSLGEQLKVDRDVEDLPKGAGQNNGKPGGGGPPDKSGGLDLNAAAASGFSASFSATGLKVGPGGRVVHTDGSPASPEDIGRLRRQIASDPQALMRRPDFFNVLSRGTFDRLKSEFHEKPETHDAAFRHVGLTDQDRDFQRTESCNKNLEKGCNPVAKEAYKKGELVSPEDLRDIDEALRADEDEEIVARSRALAAADERKGADAAEDSEPQEGESPSFIRSITGAFRAMLPGAPAETAPSATETPKARAARRAAARAARRHKAAAQASALPLSWRQVAALAGLIGIWMLVSRRRRRSFLERE